MKYYGKGGWTHNDIDTMPVYARKWDHARLVRQITEENQAKKAAQKKGGRR